MADVLTYGTHGTTFGGNPVACAAGVAVCQEVIDKGLMKRAGEIGDYLKAQFEGLKTEFPELVKDVRGRGCMLGVELAQDGQPVVDKLQDMGYLVNCTHTTVLRFLPPFIVTRDQCDALVGALRQVFAGI